jgi:uncharacterized protein YlzI (FlbEa/FlbD family)
MSNELAIRINPAEILKLQQDGKNIVVEPKAEEAIARLLEIQREVDGAVEWLKGEIERQALEYNPNFTSVKGDKIKINYSAAGAKYKDTGASRRHSPRFWKRKVTFSIDSAAVDEYYARLGRLPQGITRAIRKKNIAIKEVA